MANVLLLGGSGFIGTNLAARLRASGNHVIVASRSAGSSPSQVAVDLADTDTILALIERERIGTVVHLASTLLPACNGAAYFKDRDRIGTPTIRLVDALVGRNTRLVFFSSGGTVYGADPRERCGEDDACAPISHYGQSKFELETYIEFAVRSGSLRSLIVRPSNPYGRHQALKGPQGLISVLLGKLQHGESLEVWGDGSAVRDYIHVDDLADATARLIEPETDEGIVNVGSGAGHSLLDVVAVVESALGRQVELEFRPARSADVPRVVLDTSRIRSLIDFNPRSLEAGISDYARQLGMIE